jgi:SM-20-related protein
MSHVVTSLIELSAIAKARLCTEPYTFFIGANFLPEDAANDLIRDFPAIHKPGFHSAEEMSLRGSFRQLVEELEGPEMAVAVSARLGIDLVGHRRLTTIRKYTAAQEGRVQTDSKTKLAAVLINLNDGWSASEGGRLRVVRGPDQPDDVIAEVPPTMGSIFGFRRADNSWHGHRPFAGERRVVQIAWLQEAAPLLTPREKHGSFMRLMKSMLNR